MNKTILFTAVGMTDPISNFHDGSILHICRKYKPNTVVLFMSQETLKMHDTDNRYRRCLDMLGKQLNHEFEYKIIPNKDLVNVHMFDEVFIKIKTKLKEVIGKMDPSDKLYVNIASGTPALKYSLQFLSALAEYKFVPIIVSTPENASNKEKENQNNYDVETQWELNEDNIPEKFVDRCSTAKSLIMLKEFYTITLCKFIDNCDYSAGLAFAKSFNFNPKVIELLEGAEYRLQFNTHMADVQLAKNGYKLPFSTNDDRCAVFEYSLILGVKLKRMEWSDFLRAITPLITDILKRVLKCNWGIDIENYTCYDKNGILKWDENKVRTSEIDAVLKGAYGNDFNFYNPLSNKHLEEIVMAKCEKKSVEYKFVESIQKIESGRNKAAHTLELITDDKIKKFTGFTAEEIYKIIYDILPQINIPVKNNWNSYDEMNEYIKGSISD